MGDKLELNRRREVRWKEDGRKTKVGVMLERMMADETAKVETTM